MCDVRAAISGLDKDLRICIVLHVGELFCDSSETVGGHYGRPGFGVLEVEEERGRKEVEMVRRFVEWEESLIRRRWADSTL